MTLTKPFLLPQGTVVMGGHLFGDEAQPGGHTQAHALVVTLGFEVVGEPHESAWNGADVDLDLSHRRHPSSPSDGRPQS